MDDDRIFSVLIEIEEIAVENGLVLARPELMEAYLRVRREAPVTISVLPSGSSKYFGEGTAPKPPEQRCRILPFNLRNKPQRLQRHSC